MKKILILIFTLFATTTLANVTEHLLPKSVTAVKNNKILLSGQWQFQYEEGGKWESITVPGEATMQGYALEHDKPYMYRKEVAVPSDFNGKKILLRFDGVYSYARLFVNGKYVRDHHGGFTRWEADVTDFVKCGSKNEVMVEVTDRLDDVSYGSGYAHHTIGGILRDVTLYVVDNQTSIANLGVETLLDSIYKDATLRLRYDATVTGENTELKATLRNGAKTVQEQTYKLTSGAGVSDMMVENPLKWDAEHPNLYALDLTILQNGQPRATYTKSIGFRKVEINGNRMLVNGSQVKLRGACRHDIHPTLGRTTDTYLDSMDVVLLKRSNQNFVRTSHYPPTERFVEFCDKMGVYVECETAICFVNTHGQKNYELPRRTMHDSADYTERIMSQLREMVATHRTHASIIFWSIGNESTYGKNFQFSYDWIKAEDTTRPVIFSYPGTVPSGMKCYDIASMHYQNVEGNLNQWGVRSHGYQVDGYPALFDEWAHVPCYTYASLRDDPNIREFWGQSLDMMWSGTFDARGGLGGAIWGYIDETFMIPEPKRGKAFWVDFAHTAKPEGFRGKCVGYGEWGIIDVWRREKPEFWGTKKAYSPIRLESEKITEFATGMPLNLRVYNRFDHTYLNEVDVRFKYNGKEFRGLLDAIAPHSKGVIKVPSQEWTSGTELTVEFFDRAGELIDAYNVEIGERKVLACTKSTGELQIESSATHTIIKGSGFEIPFNKTSGLIENATSNGSVVIGKGPFLYIDVNYNHLTGAEVRSKANNFILDEALWQKAAFTVAKEGDQVKCKLSGKYGEVVIDMLITVCNSGKMDIYYQADGEPNGYLREVGLKFTLPESFSTVEWERKGYWSYYPETNFAGNRDKAPLYNTKVPAYGENPSQEWPMDTHNYYYWSDRGAQCDKPLTQWAKGMKENIRNYTLKGEKGSLSVISDAAAVACRINKQKEGQLALHVNNRWDYPEIAWGDYCKAISLTPTYGNVTIQF